MSHPVSGRVFLVGAGPGDPALLTVRGQECLQRADVVLYDYLVNPRILAWARQDSEQICLGQHGRTRIWSQAEINKALVELARSGKTVVRLKGGDPAVFARGGDEVDALRDAAIPYEIVPGITTVLAAGSYASIPITYRGIASAVALITGHEEEGKAEALLDYHGLAVFPGTLVFYMGVTTANVWSKALIDAGKSPDTPVAIIRRCSLPDQRILRCRLSEVVERIQEPPRIRPPAIAIVGPVADLPGAVSWYEQRPLFGRRVLVTRPIEQSESLSRRLTELGADVYFQPAIRIAAPSSYELVDAAINRLHQFDWLVFSSVNGIRFFFNRLWELGMDFRALSSVRLAAIGPGTADELGKYHLRPDIIPDEFRAESLAAELAKICRGKRCLLARASRGREVLAETLQSSGAHVEQIVVYESEDVETADADVAAQLASSSMHWVTITSSAIAKSLVNLFGENLRQSKLVSISPITSATLRSIGFEPAVEARDYTMDGIVDAILDFEAK